jgi:hypothetical protein
LHMAFFVDMKGWKTYFQTINKNDTISCQPGKAFHTHVFLYTCTSSTAQGGGGSFKNRKPIGEVGCCESRMA